MVAGYILEIAEIVNLKPASWLSNFLGLHAHRARVESSVYLLWEQRAFAALMAAVYSHNKTY